MLYYVIGYVLEKEVGCLLIIGDSTCPISHDLNLKDHEWIRPPFRDTSIQYAIIWYPSLTNTHGDSYGICWGYVYILRLVNGFVDRAPPFDYPHCELKKKNQTKPQTLKHRIRVFNFNHAPLCNILAISGWPWKWICCVGDVFFQHKHVRVYIYI